MIYLEAKWSPAGCVHLTDSDGNVDIVTAAEKNNSYLYSSMFGTGYFACWIDRKLEMDFRDMLVKDNCFLLKFVNDIWKVKILISPLLNNVISTSSAPLAAPEINR